MANKLSALNTLQAAKQSTFGTPIASASAKLQNITSFNPSVDWQTRTIDRARGDLAPSNDIAMDTYSAAGTFEISDETFEDLNYWLDSMFDKATATGSTTPYVRAYAAPLGGASTPQLMTLWWGQSDHAIRLQDALLTTLTLSAATNSGLQVGGSILASKGVTNGISMSSLADRTGQTRITGCMGKVYIDTWEGTMGTTEIANEAFSYELTLNANRSYRGFIGACFPSKWTDQKRNGQLKLSLEIENGSKALIDEALDTANKILKKQIQIVHEVGATTGLRSLKIQFTGATMQAPVIFQEREGIVSIDLVFDGVYHQTFGNWLKIETKSAIQTLV